MSSLYRIFRSALCAGLLTAATAAAANDAQPLGAGQAAELLGCRVPLATARDNLKNRGYVVEATGAEVFATQYKMNEKDSERRLLGSLAVERARRYEVNAAGAEAVRFVPRLRETTFASGALGKRNDTVREYEVPLTTAMAETLKDMRREVCEPLGQPSWSGGGTAVNLDLQQYLQDRCKAADERACRLLQAGAGGAPK